jgi:GDP-L-fucose synthase
MKKRILVLGGYGFMGKHINAVFCKDENYQLFNESRSTGCDVMNIFQLKSKISSTYPDVIIFAAANVGSVNYVSENAADVIYDNAQMYLNLYKAVSETNKDILIINPLANCSYPGIIDIQNEDEWWNGRIHESVEAYGMTKKMSYIISRCFNKQYEIKTINLMLPGCYGEMDHLEEEKTHAMNGIITRMIQAKKNNEKLFTVWGTGSPIREWVYMSDVARLFKEVIDENRLDLPDMLNIGQENGISITDIALKVKKVLNYDVEIVYDTSKQDGALIKTLGSKKFKQYFPDFKFTDYDTALNNTITYYNSVL